MPNTLRAMIRLDFSAIATILCLALGCGSSDPASAETESTSDASSAESTGVTSQGSTGGSTSADSSGTTTSSTSSADASTSSGDASTSTETGAEVCECGALGLTQQWETTFTKGYRSSTRSLGTSITPSGDTWTMRHPAEGAPLDLMHVDPDGVLDVTPISELTQLTNEANILGLAATEQGVAFAVSQPNGDTSIVLYDPSLEFACEFDSGLTTQNLLALDDGSWLVVGENNVIQWNGCGAPARTWEGILDGERIQTATVDADADTLLVAGNAFATEDSNGSYFVRRYAGGELVPDFDWSMDLPELLGARFKAAHEAGRVYFAVTDTSTSEITVDVLTLETEATESYGVTAENVSDFELVASGDEAWLAVAGLSAVELHGIGAGCCAEEIAGSTPLLGAARFVDDTLIIEGGDFGLLARRFSRD